MRQRRLSLALAAPLAFGVAAGCGEDDPYVMGPTQATGILGFVANDPRGDTLAATAPRLRAHDVVSLHATVARDSLVVTILFAEGIAPFSTRLGQGMVAIVDLDTDADSTTGKPAIANVFGATANIGADWSIVYDDSVTKSGNHRIQLVDLATGAVHWVPASYGGSTVTVRLPLARIRMADATHVRLVGVVGTSERVSDVMPNAGALDVPLD